MPSADSRVLAVVESYTLKNLDQGDRMIIRYMTLKIRATVSAQLVSPDPKDLVCRSSINTRGNIKLTGLGVSGKQPCGTVLERVGTVFRWIFVHDSS